MALCFALSLLGLSIADTAQASFVVGETYIISVEAINSNGQVTSPSSGNSLRVSTTAIADNNGKLSFSLSGLPDSSSYNFLVVTIKDTVGNTVRRSIVPAPAAGQSVNFGVSPVTENQTTAFLKVFKNAGTDDPLLAFFGFLLVRSANVTENEIIQMADFCLKGIKGNDGTGLTDGFEAKLRNEGATTAQLAALKTNLVANFAGLASLYKDSVDEFFTSGSTAELEKRGEAAAKLFEYLVNATNDAGINVESLLMAFNSMGAIVVPLIDNATTAGLIRSSVAKGMDATISRGLQKLRRDNFLKKYSNAMTTLGASTSDVDKFTSAVNTLTATMQELFKDFEKVAMKDEAVDADDIDTQNATMNAAMEAAFTQYMSDAAATDAEILELRTDLADTFGVPLATLDPDMFKFYSREGQTNWPITMVVAARYINTIVDDGGSLSYTRDDLPIPAAMIWLGGSRTDYSTPPQSWSGSLLNLGNLLELREDIEIAEFTRFAAFGSIDFSDQAQAMIDMETAENAFYDKLEVMTSKIGATIDGTTPISDAVKKALLTIFLSPDF